MKERLGLTKFLQSLDPKILVTKMQCDVLEHFSDGPLAKFASDLFENDDPMLEIARYHQDSFIDLYGKCKVLKNSCKESSNSGTHIAVLFFLRKDIN